MPSNNLIVLRLEHPLPDNQIEVCVPRDWTHDIIERKALVATGKKYVVEREDEDCMLKDEDGVPELRCHYLMKVAE